MDKNTENIANIRTRIIGLEKQLDDYCSHEATSFNGYSDYYGGEVYMCKDCGKVFVNQNIDDLIND